MKNYLVKIILCCSVLLLTACGQPEAETEVFSPVLIEENAFTFDDGISVSLWQDGIFPYYYYQLEDETNLLEFWDYIDSDYVMPLLENTNTSSAAREAICAYYENAAPMYDIESLLLDAYEDYLLCAQENTKFRTHPAGADITLTAETARFVACLAFGTQPESLRFDGTVCETRISTLFDISTGEIINMWDTFRIPADEAKKELLSLCGGIARMEEMEQAIDSAYLLWFPDTLEIWFPAGSLKSQDITAGGGFSYEELEGLLQLWAIPVGKN